MSEYKEPTGFKGSKGDWVKEKEKFAAYRISTGVKDKYVVIAEVKHVDYHANNLTVTEANAVLLVNAKEAIKALQELLRFENLFNHVAPELQYPDNFLKAVENAKQVISQSIPK